MTDLKQGVVTALKDGVDFIERDGSGKSVAVVVAGNGCDWEPDAWIWLPAQVAYELDEANSLNIRADDTVKHRETTVYVYEMST